MNAALFHGAKIVNSSFTLKYYMTFFVDYFGLYGKSTTFAPMKLVFATNNRHKLEEARAILGSSVDVVSLAELGCNDDIEETADTLEGNSAIKAHYIWDKYGVDCFADDTGLEVKILGGAPGVRSARYAGEPQDSARNRRKLLHDMQGETDRTARFRTVVTLVCNGVVHTFEGIVTGSLLTEERGSGGFGYDSLFVPDGYTETFAQLGEEVKNRISHRARAMQALADYIKSNL